MSPVALDGTKLLMLMAAGAIFALAGLWLLFRRPMKGQAANIEMFGLKFQSSSAGLLVFLIGAGFLAVPVFVPERPRPASVPTGAGGTGATAKAVPLQAQAIPLDVPDAAFAEGAEIEPNDSIARANTVQIGTSISGSVGPEDADYFLLPVPEGVTGTMIVSITNREPRNVRLSIYDSVGAVLLDGWHYSSGSKEFKITDAKYYVRIAADDDLSYELMMAARPK